LKVTVDKSHPFAKIDTPLGELLNRALYALPPFSAMGQAG
jgi:hypothetical protein